MSSENIEFVKPPVNSSKDKKLAGVGVGLVLLGLLGAAQLPVVASDPPVGATGLSVSGSTINWSGTFLFFPNDAKDYNWITVCNVDDNLSEENQDCTRDNALQTFSPNPLATSAALYSDDTYRVFQPVQKDVPFGPGTFVVQLLLERNSVVTKVGLPKFIGPLVARTALQTPVTPVTPPSTASLPAPPPIQFEFKGVASASQLLAGNRNFTFEGENVADVLAVRVNGRSVSIVNRLEDSFQVRLPKLGPGSYSVTIYTETANWEIPDAIVIGELLPIVRQEAVQESFIKHSSDLPQSSKREIRAIMKATPTLRKITVTAIAYAEILRPNGNKLAKSRAQAAIDFIERVAPGVRIETKLIHRSQTELSPRSLAFRVAQKKS